LIKNDRTLIIMMISVISVLSILLESKKSMKKDIQIPKVEDVGIGVILEADPETGEDIWNAYLLNFKDKMIQTVLISTKGYGLKDKEEVETSTLRHYIDKVEKKSYAKIEQIKENLFGLTNEFMLTFYIGRTIYDKKFVFVPETIKENNMIEVPLIEKKGVLISS
ncbi:MAG: hypothetical protein ABEH43_09605, partial [Flavobacteriales bacterium]